MKKYLAAFVCLSLSNFLLCIFFAENFIDKHISENIAPNRRKFSSDSTANLPEEKYSLPDLATMSLNSRIKLDSRKFSLRSESNPLDYISSSPDSIRIFLRSIIESPGSQKFSSGLKDNPSDYISTAFDSRQYSFDSSTTHKCELPKLDPWDETIQQYLDPDFRPMKDCRIVKQPVETVLSKKGLRIKKRDVSLKYLCKYRCLFFMNEYMFHATKWTKFKNRTMKTNCELIQTKCSRDNETVHENLHVQIPKVSIADKSSKRNKLKPSVFMIILDSVSNSNGLRSLTETSQVLRYKYGGVNFRGLNKVGWNSRPNAWALFTGLRIEALPAGSIHEHEIESELPDSCDQYVDDFPYVGYNFSSAGYRSIMIEDWWKGAFVWPFCSGFYDNPVTHNMKPYWQALNANGGTPQLLKNYCKSTYDISLEYLEQFIKAYQNDVPKFAVVWITELAHYDPNGLYQIDHSLAQFFIKYEAQLENSFIFLMGDHGMRFTDIRTTKIGEYEDNNPFLTISIPKALQKNAKLLENMNSNSQILTTHFDLYLTLMDIAAILPLSNFTDFEYFDWFGFMPKNRGSSLLRHIDPSKRNCKSLDISEMYCNCKRNKTELTAADGINIQSSIAYKGAEFLTTALNDVLKEYNAQSECSELNLTSVDSAEIIHENGKVFYYITYSVLPSDGLFQGVIRVFDNESLVLISTTQNRVNSYGNESYCVTEEELRPICYCKDVVNDLSSESTTAY